MEDINYTLPTQLLRLRELVMARFRVVLNSADLTDAKWRVLRILLVNGDLDFAELSNSSLVLKPSLSRLLSSLETRDLVERRDVEADQRQIEVALTPTGRAFVLELMPQINNVYAGLEELLGFDRLSDLTTLTRACISQLENESEPQPQESEKTLTAVTLRKGAPHHEGY